MSITYYNLRQNFILQESAKDILVDAFIKGRTMHHNISNNNYLLINYIHKKF